MVVFIDGKTRKAKQDKDNNLYINYNLQKYILIDTKEHTAILQNADFTYDKKLALIQK